MASCLGSFLALTDGASTQRPPPQRCTSSSPTLFEMDVSAPDPATFTARIAELHHKGYSPNGMFGFGVITCDGKFPHTVTWEKSWAVFFVKFLQGVLNLDIETNGSWPPMETAAKQILNAVIPRLLGILQTRDRTLKPSVIHGDLWEGNVGSRLDTGRYRHLQRWIIQRTQ